MYKRGVTKLKIGPRISRIIRLSRETGPKTWRTPIFNELGHLLRGSRLFIAMGSTLYLASPIRGAFKTLMIKLYMAPNGAEF